MDFPSTAWTDVLRALDGIDAVAVAKLAGLLRRYWPPLFSYARRRGIDEQDAADVVQGFVTELLEGRAFWTKLVKHSDPSRNQFRVALQRTFRDYLAHFRRGQSAARRRPERLILSLDFQDVAGRTVPEPTSAIDPGQLFDVDYALQLVEAVVEVLGEEYHRRGKGAEFQLLRPLLPGCLDPAPTSAALADRLGVKLSAAEKRTSRFRRRFEEAFFVAVRATVGRAEDVEPEVRQLLETLRYWAHVQSERGEAQPPG